jgi:hypothetical protein
MAHAQSPKEIVLEFYKLALEKFDPKTSEPALDTPSGKVLKTQSTVGAGSESDRIATAPR